MEGHFYTQCILAEIFHVLVDRISFELIMA